MKDHPIAAGAWLLLVVGGIGFLATSGLKSGAEHERDAAKSELNKELEEIIEAGRRGEYDVAIKGLEAMIVKYPKEPSIYLNLGIAQRAADKLDDADKTFAKVLELDPSDYDAIAERANILREKGDLEGAVAMMDKIPAGAGRVNMRLRDDPLWLEVAEDPKVKALRQKHGVEEGTDTSLQMLRNKEKGAAQGVAVP
jgi:tetratricopeptide (TPR) repeat protein